MTRHYVFLGGTITTVTQIFGTLRCSIPVNAAGQSCDADWQPLPLADRPERCSHQTDILIGAAPTCLCHLRELPHVDPTTSLSELLGDLLPVECAEGTASGT